MAATYKSVDAGTAKRLVDAGARTVDVRSKEEWDAGHVEGADRARKARIGPEDIGRADTVLVVDRDGRKSRRAAKRLAKFGYTVYRLEGGLLAWQEAGFPLASATQRRAEIL